MTPKEKAKDLVDRYYWTFGDGYLGEQHIQCALIAVDEMIKELERCFIHNEYWQEVKTEIEAL
jgi:hypothetical protein